jgi:hypothetical protein
LQRVFNTPKLMSSCNRKGYDNVDTQGNAQLYTIGMRVFATGANVGVSTAPNTYVTRRAVKAWHDARVMMYKRAGISMKSLGYGSTLRPYLDINHENGTTTEIDSELDMNADGEGTPAASGITPHFTGDEWTYSRAAVSVPVENTAGGSPQSRDFVDTYSFTLCGSSVSEADTPDDPDESGTIGDGESFVSVGMLKEWLGSFKKKRSTAGAPAHQIDDDNALLQLVSQQGLDKEEVLELAQSGQDEGRPWDLGGSTHHSTMFAGYLRSVSSESSYIVFQAPCGLFNLDIENTAAAGEIHYEFDVLDISDM